MNKKNKEIFNNVCEAIIHGKNYGCIGALYCDNCGKMNHGTCLCMGIFTCDKCGHEHTNSLPKYTKTIPEQTEIKFTIDRRIETKSLDDLINQTIMIQTERLVEILRNAVITEENANEYTMIHSVPSLEDWDYQIWHNDKCILEVRMNINVNM